MVCTSARNNQDLREAWPLRKLLNPLFRSFLSFWLQMADDTSNTPCDTRSPNPPTVLVEIFVKSTLQRPNISGLGLPVKFLIPSVKRAVVATANASPNQPTCHSQSLSRYSTDLGMPRRTLVPGTMRRHIRKMMTAGAATAIAPSTGVEICSSRRWGNDMSGLVRSKGLWYGVVLETPRLTPAMALMAGY